MAASPITAIDLYWLPLGAGGHSIRLNGRVFEAIAARLERRDRCDLYHSALDVRVPKARFVIEQAPIRRGDGAERGVVTEGAVGVRAVGLGGRRGSALVEKLATLGASRVPPRETAALDSAL